MRQSLTHLTTIHGKPYRVGYVDVVYGTKQIDRFPPPRGFLVDEESEKQLCGLTVDTVFDLGDHQVLPWSPHYFPLRRGKSLITGRFSDAMQQRLRHQARELTP